MIPVVEYPNCKATFHVETPPAALDAARLEERQSIVAWIRAQVGTGLLLSRVAAFVEAGAHIEGA